MFEKINNQIVESDRDRGRRVGQIDSLLENDTYLVKIEGYERKAKLKSRLNEKYRVGDIVKLEPVGFNNRLEITGRTGARRYTEKLVEEQLQELLSGTSFSASEISYGDTLIQYLPNEPRVPLVQLVIDYLVTRLYAAETRINILEDYLDDLEERVEALE